jgi:two-component system, response regulator RegA
VTPCGSPTRGQQITQPIDSGAIVQRFAAQMFCAPLGAPRYIRRTSTMAEARSLQNVLVVDDDERILGSWKRAARERNVFTAIDAATARQLASTEKPDLAIVDLRLGNTSGIDLIRDLKRDLPDLLVVLCSGYLSVAAAVAAVRAGADIVVFKPITFREILQRIEQNAEEPDLEDTPTLARAEWEHIMRVLADCNGNVSMAARRLGIYRSSLQRRLRKYAPRS